MKLIWILALLPSLTLASVKYHLGTATKEGKPVYTEKHAVTWDDATGEVLEANTEYINNDGKTIATLKSDFRPSITNPAHEMNDLRDDRRYGVRYEGEQAIMWDKKKDEKERSEKLKKGFADDRTVIGSQGLHYYMRTRLTEYHKKKLNIALLIPGRMDWFGFLVEYKGEKNGRWEYYAKAQSFFLRLFAPSLTVWYTPDGQLLEFVGPSNVNDDKGEIQNVRITYEYPAEPSAALKKASP